MAHLDEIPAGIAACQSEYLLGHDPSLPPPHHLTLHRIHQSHACGQSFEYLRPIRYLDNIYLLILVKAFARSQRTTARNRTFKLSKKDFVSGEPRSRYISSNMGTTRWTCKTLSTICASVSRIRWFRRAAHDNIYHKTRFHRPRRESRRRQGDEMTIR